MEITLLGTSSMVPTAHRNHSGYLLRYKAEMILIDCGEGTQRQFRKAKLSPTKITKILITHWHGDHVLGLPGLMMTLAANNYNKKLQIYGPPGTKESVRKMFDFYVQRELVEWEAHEVQEGVFFENDDFQLESLPLQHAIPCLGYRFQEKDRRKLEVKALKKLGVAHGPHLKQLQQGEDIIYKGNAVKVDAVSTVVKGKAFAIVTDTRTCNNAVLLAQGVDLFLCESTYGEDMKDEARKRKHMTAKEAATIAYDAGVQQLVLIHFSQRYKTVKPLEKEAKAVFKKTIAGDDLAVFTV